MPIIVKLRTGEALEVDSKEATIGEILRKLGFSTEEYIAVVNGVVVTEFEKVREGDEIILFPVVSGG